MPASDLHRCFPSQGLPLTIFNVDSVNVVYQGSTHDHWQADLKVQQLSMARILLGLLCGFLLLYYLWRRRPNPVMIGVLRDQLWTKSPSYLAPPQCVTTTALPRKLAYPCAASTTNSTRPLFPVDEGGILHNAFDDTPKFDEPRPHKLVRPNVLRTISDPTVESARQSRASTAPKGLARSSTHGALATPMYLAPPQAVRDSPKPVASSTFTQPSTSSPAFQNRLNPSLTVPESIPRCGPTKRALLVIPEYSDIDERDLRRHVNRARRTLKDFGFERDIVKLATGESGLEAPTRAALISSLDWLARGAKDGDIFCCAVFVPPNKDQGLFTRLLHQGLALRTSGLRVDLGFCSVPVRTVERASGVVCESHQAMPAHTTLVNDLRTEGTIKPLRGEAIRKSPTSVIRFGNHPTRQNNSSTPTKSEQMDPVSGLSGVARRLPNPANGVLWIAKTILKHRSTLLAHRLPSTHPYPTHPYPTHPYRNQPQLISLTELFLHPTFIFSPNESECRLGHGSRIRF